MKEHVKEVLEKLYKNRFNSREEMEWDLLSLLKREENDSKSLALLVMHALSGNRSVLNYIENNLETRDKLVTKSKISLLGFVRLFLQMHPEEVLSHLLQVFKQTIRIFRKDESSGVKVAAAQVIKKVLKVYFFFSINLYQNENL